MSKSKGGNGSASSTKGDSDDDASGSSDEATAMISEVPAIPLAAASEISLPKLTASTDTGPEPPPISGEVARINQGEAERLLQKVRQIFLKSDHPPPTNHAALARAVLNKP